MRCAVVFIAGLGSLLGCASKTPARPMPPFQDSVCRGYAIPAGTLPSRCTSGGPYPGMLEGEVIGPATDLVYAVKSCLSEPDCTGITADWYVGAKFTAIRSKEPFLTSQDSYGCTFLIACTTNISVGN